MFYNIGMVYHTAPIEVVFILEFVVWFNVPGVVVCGMTSM